MKPDKNHFLLLFFLPLILLGQAKDCEAAFKKTCLAITKAFAKQDLKTLNKYIKRDVGLYIITRPGAMDAVNKIDSLDRTSLSFYPYKDSKSIKKFALKYAPAPKFDCGTEKWSRVGFVADTSRQTRLTELLDFLVKYEMRPEDQAERSKLMKLEGQSRKVVFTELAKKHGIVFHLTLIGGKWYLYLLDTVASDCSA